MSTDGVYCKWCGTLVTGGGLFCPSCGRRVEESTAASGPASRAQLGSTEDDETDESTGPFAKLAEVFGRSVAFILALIVALAGTVLPVLFVVALFMGPGDTWDMVRGWMPGGGNDNAACVGFSDWYEESAERPQLIMSKLEDYDETGSSADTATLLSMAEEADTLATDQRRSNPPQEAIVLNGMMVETIEFMADALRAMANGDQSQLQFLMLESERLTLEFETEEERVFDACR